MTTPGPKPTPEQIARARKRLIRGLTIYLGSLIVIAYVVGVVTGSAVAGFLTFLGILLIMPVVATWLRISYQKRKGLPVRGYWNR